jgi:5-methylcytosine-specific restriction protein A
MLDTTFRFTVILLHINVNPSASEEVYINNPLLKKGKSDTTVNRPASLAEGEEMPYAPRKPCSQPGCPALTNGRPCPKHKKRRYSKRRHNASQRGYDYKWQLARKHYLQANPVCTDAFNRHDGRPVAATVVDHIEPHRGDMEKFWDLENNVQALCRHCHDSKTARGM